MINKRLLKKEYEHIRDNGPVSTEWTTETPARAKRFVFLRKIGAIVRDKDDKRDHSPYCVYICDDEAFKEGVEG